MNFLDLKDISERTMELVNPTSPEKILKVGQALGLTEGSRVIDFGTGFGEVLALWADAFGIRGVGIDIRPLACQRARAKMAARGLADRIEIVCGSASEYKFEPHAYDVAACLGASFVWGGFQPTVHRLKDALRPGGRIVIGEPYWRTPAVPPDYSRHEATVFTENELFQQARAEGMDVLYVVRASEDDWDRYETDNWRGLLAWLEENPDHAERAQVLDTLRTSQDEYTRWGRAYFGWAIYILTATP